jgi:uncharacterized membrane protein
MPVWLIPMAYTVVSVICGLVLPRLENAYLPGFAHDMAVGSALAFYSSVSSGMMALTGIVFAIAFVMVQFGAAAYSPRLVVLLSGDRTLFHTLGLFFATFAYSLAALGWTDRGGSGTTPLFSGFLVLALLIASMLAFARLIHKLDALQVHNILRNIGNRGRAVIRTLFVTPPGADKRVADAALPPETRVIVHSGEPWAVARFDIGALVRLARAAGAVLVIESAVGDTVVEEQVLLRVHGASAPLADRAVRRCIHLASTRTFEQDPKYAIRLLVDIAIRALSPAINDPTTAVQALDQIEDLLRRLARRELDAGRAYDSDGTLRVIFPMPSWEDYLALSFDEIRHFGVTSVQVVRRLRAALTGLSEVAVLPERRAAVQRYLDHIDRGIGRSAFDEQDRDSALQEDRQGLGLSRKRAGLKQASGDGRQPDRPLAPLHGETEPAGAISG